MWRDSRTLPTTNMSNWPYYVVLSLLMGLGCSDANKVSIKVSCR